METLKATPLVIKQYRNSHKRRRDSLRSGEKTEEYFGFTKNEIRTSELITSGKQVRYSGKTGKFYY